MTESTGETRVRQTSIDCYNQIKAEGLLSKLRLKVYNWLYENGPATASEITTGLADGSQNHGCFTTRLSELRNQGVVKECGLVISKTTGRKVIEWDVTDQLPVKPVKTKSAKELRTREALDGLALLHKDIESYDAWKNLIDLIKAI